MSRSVVYCPPLVPRGPTRSQNRSSRGKVSISARAAAYELHFVSPSMQRRDPRAPGPVHLGHWVVGAYTPIGLSRHDPLSHQTFRELVHGEGTRIVESTEIGDTSVVVVKRSERALSVYSGHVSVVWRRGGRTFVVSVHGWEHKGAALEMARGLIDEMGPCPPGACTLVFEAGRAR